MSGGVDSSVAALLLKEQGLHVQGVTFQFVRARERDPGTASGCSSVDMVESARQVCEGLEIPHHLIDHTDDFERRVIDPFCSEYEAGSTPNPCVQCNVSVKWPSLLGGLRSRLFLCRHGPLRTNPQGRQQGPTLARNGSREGPILCALLTSSDRP